MLTKKHKAKATNSILLLHDELQQLQAQDGTKTRSMSAGRGIIPDSWVPWVNFIEVFLILVYPFVGAKLRKAIDAILKAINLFQGEGK